MVVIVVIGILSAIAIAAFLNQRKKANDATAQSDVRNAVLAVETMLVDGPNAQSILSAYLEDGKIKITLYAEDVKPMSYNQIQELYPLSTTELNLSEGVEVAVMTTTPGAYVIGGGHANGSKVFYYSSVDGGFIEMADE